MKILITGHQGFVGRYFYRKLNEDTRNLVWGIDIQDGVDCRDFFDANDVTYDLVIHCAAIVGGRENIEGRPMAVADNFSIDSEFFQWCAKTKPHNIVYFSSSAVYPVELQTSKNAQLLREDMQSPSLLKSPDLTYGMSKLMGEYLASFIDNVFIFRPFSGYGTDQDLAYPFPQYVQRAIQRQNPFQIWGTGLQTRDFIHISDIYEAVMIAVKERISGVTNLGWGRSTSFRDLATMVTLEAGYKPDRVFLERKPVGCMHRVADTAKMRSFYEPKITLEEGIRRAIQGLT